MFDAPLLLFMSFVAVVASATCLKPCFSPRYYLRGSCLLRLICTDLFVCCCLFGCLMHLYWGLDLPVASGPALNNSPWIYMQRLRLGSNDCEQTVRVSLRDSPWTPVQASTGEIQGKLHQQRCGKDDIHMRGKNCFWQMLINQSTNLKFVKRRH